MFDYARVVERIQQSDTLTQMYARAAKKPPPQSPASSAPPAIFALEGRKGGAFYEEGAVRERRDALLPS